MNDFNVTIRPRVWESERFEPTTTVTLTPLDESRWDVRHDGALIGEVERYQGSHDRRIPGTRLRRQGKRKDLWAATSPGGRPDYYREHGTRADAIRALLTAAGFR